MADKVTNPEEPESLQPRKSRRGLWVGIELYEEAGTARQHCERLMADGMLCKDTHAQTIRLAPPLCITRQEIDWALERLRKVLA